MIPVSHILILALLQFTIGLLGLMLRRAGMVMWCWPFRSVVSRMWLPLCRVTS